MAAGGRLIFRLFVLSLIFFLGGSVFSFYSLLYEQNDVSESTVVLVEKGENLNQIARRLKQENLLSSIAVFKAAARLSGKTTSLRAGEYRIPAHASAKEILDILVSGQTVVRRVTIPEGKTSRQIFDILAQTPGLTGELPELPPNGMLLPETYVFSYGSPRKIIVERMLSGMQKTIDELWPGRDDDLPYTTKEEALVLASIIEKETSVASERPRIAGVFINRLRKGMRLQTDPTVIYAVTDGTMELRRRLTHKDLKAPHPFNTYMNKGLPPAPICNPGRESIQAVLKPQKTNEIYFVADGTGGHVFSRSFDEHRRNILNWKKARQQKRLAARKNRAIQKKQTVKSEAVKEAPVLVQVQTEAEKQEELLRELEEQDLSLDIAEETLEVPPEEKKVEKKAEKKMPPVKKAVSVKKTGKKKK
ncbi:MAG: endolytic transglycosylase MltG [Alphaproteobacteria bacterium]|nr:endolytic transglycosylase MltG [Alphaproteobacteria bacterium]MBO4643703.1 endolytic transglycosylase MltG [Alphaproteobacteria bacterium]